MNYYPYFDYDKIFKFINYYVIVSNKQIDGPFFKKTFQFFILSLKIVKLSGSLLFNSNKCIYKNISKKTCDTIKFSF